MSIKDLFKNRESFKLSSLKSADKVARELGESSEFIEQFEKDRDRFIPSVNYNEPANFARYGLAERYYDDAIKRIYNTYPYDGSLREKLAWHNSSSYIDKHVFENEYPRTNGYIIFSADGWDSADSSQVSGYGETDSVEYIDLKGGPHTGSSMAVLKSGFAGSNIYDVDSNRQSNLEFNLAAGTTVEFWLKKDSFETSDNTQKEVVFDLWNGEASTGAGYGRLRIELDGDASGSPFRITALSGTNGFHQQPIGSGLTTTSLTSWKHYAFTFLSGASDISASLYVDGALNHSTNPTGTGSINEVTGVLNAYIGALKTAAKDASGTAAGWGKLSASLDEFRYWKTKRSSEDVGRYWFTQVHGGTNTDTDKYNDRNPVDLGVYYKFNEGITLTSSTDSKVLDYSGRFSNGSWTGYTSNSRNVGSAILSASAAKTEFKDPILYSFHPDVKVYSNEKKLSGSAHDVQNNAAIYNMLPRWVIDDDIEGGGHIKNLTQILASYFDTLQLQIEALPTLREATYSTYTSASISSSAKPLPFANRLLEGLGLETPELFIDAEIIEKLASRDENRNFEKELHDIKNLIYHNIYNNLAYVYKSKGTEKAFRNLVRCFGIDDELIKFNIYGQNALYKFKDNFKSSVIRKSVVDFNHPDRNAANIYQYPINSELGYITGSDILIDLPCTIEAEIIFPKKKKSSETGYYNTTFFTSSLFGAHSASVATATDMTWAPDDVANFQVYAIRTSSLDSDYDTRDAYFKLTSSSPFPFTAVTSSVFDDVYDDTKWNFAVRLKHDKHEQNNMVVGTTGSPKATATLTFSAGDRPDAGDTLTLTSTDGTEKTYTWVVQASEDASAAAVHASNTTTTQVDSLQNAIEHSNNHGGKITCSQDATGLILTLTQVAGGDSGNTTISKTGATDAQIDISSFTGGLGTGKSYTVELYGVNTILDEVINEFSASTSVTDVVAESFLSGSKRLYMGTHRTNFTGTVLENTDIKASSLRFWYDYLDNDTIKAHAKDPTNFGLKNPYRNLSLFHTGANNEYTPSIEALALNWDFETITGSDANGRFEIYDYSSGSTSLTGRYGDLGTVTKRKYPGRGDNFVASATSSIDKNYFYIAKQQLPESIFSSDMINIVDEDDATFTRESRPTQFFFAAEKSMYQTISEEMVNFFATIVDFNNLIGDPVNRYRSNYKELTKLRQLFFERIDNTPDLDKFVDFYKWIDESITIILKQMMPASANVSDGLRTMVENHIFERNKYHNKFPTLRSRRNEFDAAASTPGNERPFSKTTKILPSFKHSSFGYKAPSVSSLQNENSYWWLTRAERNHPTITSGDANVDKDRNKILSASSPEMDSFRKRGRTHAIRFEGDFPIHGGVNFRKNKDIRYAHRATSDFGPTTIFTAGSFSVTASNNFVLFMKSDVEDFPDTVDRVIPAELDKKKWKYIAANNSEIEIADEYNYNILKGDLVIPFNLYKHDVVISGGYHDSINSDFKEGVDFTNLHVDAYGPDNEIPMQGPFTEKYVGGMQHRHIDINRFDVNKGTGTNLDSDSNRPEDWFILMGSLVTGEEAVGVVGPTYTTDGEYDKDFPRARFYRDFTAKSPINIRNIRTTGSTLGNYSSSIEYVSSVGRTQNNAFFKENEGVSLPSKYAADLPKTTNVHSLFGVGVSTEEGNIFGPSSVNLNRTSNRVATDTEFSLPRLDLTGSDSIIVSRFSAPGGPEINSRGYLDIMAEEYSVYNALPYRNLSVRGSGSGESSTIRSAVLPGAGREGLRSLLTRHQGKFGIDNRFSSIKEANYDTVGAFHKIPRNILRRIEYENEHTDLSGSTITASVYNNAWYSTPIPRSDLQYSWLTASFDSYPAKGETYGHAPIDGHISSSVEGVVPAYNFVSASHVTNSNGIVASFAGYNTIVVDGVDSDQNLLSASFPSGYVNNDLGTISTNPEVANVVTLLRNGPYQWPTWKQIRTGENQVARYQRRNNILSITTEPDKIFTTNEGEAVIPEQMGGILRQFTESPVTSKYKPIIHILESDNLIDPFDRESKNPRNPRVHSGLSYTYANDKDMFPNDEINHILDLKNNFRSAYDVVADMYIDSPTDTAVGEFSLLSYRETIFPQPENAYLSGSRSRLTFAHPEWKSSRPDRKRASVENSMVHIVTKQSMWPLDARNDFATAAVINPGTGSGAGELQNGYTIFHNGANLGSTAGSTNSVRFPLRAYLTASSGHSSGPLNRDYSKSTTISLWFKTGYGHRGGGTGPLSSSMIVKGFANGTLNYAPAYEIRMNNRGITVNVGQERGHANEISYGDNQLPEPLSDVEWRNVVLTWDDSGDADSMKLYINADEKGSSVPGTAPATASALVFFGARPPGIDDASGSAGTGFKGFMDEISFWSGSMSAAQVTTLYNSGNPINVVNTDFTGLSLLSHYRMGEHANDGPLATETGFIQDATAPGVAIMSGNLSASCSGAADFSGFSNTGYGILTDAPFNVGAGGNDNIYGPVYSRQTPERDDLGAELGYYAGDTLWEAASQAGKDPFYNSYDDYREEMRLVAKDYTIIPEFRISEHMEYYVNTNAGNFLIDNDNWLQLTGAAANKTSSAETDFFKTYTNSDFMKYFDIVKQEHADAGHKPTIFALQCKAAMKFLPYEGFYPASRTLQLATLFSESYSENVNFKDESAGATAGAFGAHVSYKTLLTPLFAPGILYNSIKSGIAVDHPIMTSSFSSIVSDFDTASDISGSYRISSSFGFRLPFESLVEPENYLGGVTIVDYEVHPSASINSTASWDGTGGPLYKAAMHNFTAEVPKFFLRGGGVSGLVSAKDDDGKHFKAEFGKEYRMRVVMRNGGISRRRQIELNAPRDNSKGQDVSLTGSFFTNPSVMMYSRRSAFGPPTHAEYVKYKESYEPFTPPYMDGYADVEFSFTPEETRFHFIDEIVSSVSSSFYRIGEQYFTTGSDGTLPSSVAATNQMQISASLNLLDIVKTKKATYDPVTGKTLLVEDDAQSPSVALIQPKWETPILNFKNVSVTLPTYGSGSVSRGMWHQYGSEPTVTEGVFLEIQDLTKEEMDDSNLTGSLADLMGFSKSAIKLGAVLDEKVVREAVVAIPFLESGGKKVFFNIPRNQIKEAIQLSQIDDPSAAVSPSTGKSIVDMVTSMSRYVFPPKLDFITNETVEPIAMYIFEFEHKFSKQDLIDIWQNLPPKVGRKFKTKSVLVQHRLLENELMKGGVRNSLRWMVFKVKQKAADNYFKMLTDSIQEKGFSFELLRRGGLAKDSPEFNYSFNWPYDFFSLIELVKMDAEVIIENKTDEE